MEKRYRSFQKALKKFVEILNMPESEIVRDSSIIRFQFVFDLCWKVMKDEVNKQGVECYSPRECIKSSFTAGLIGYDENWLKMIDDRNNIAHLYNEEIARQVFQNLTIYRDLFIMLIKKISEKEKLPLEEI